MSARMQAGVGAPVAAAPRPPSPVVDPGTWFEASTPSGLLRLCAFTGEAVRHAVEAALALERCEPLLAGLEAWTGVALDWRWMSKAPHRPGPSHAAACWEPEPERDPSGAPRELLCLLSMPWTLLRALPAPDPDLAAHLRWPSVPGVLAIAQLLIEPAELQMLEPGGAVMLPESLQSPWMGRLRGAGEPMDGGAAVVLDPPSSPRLVRTALPALPVGGAERIPCEVRLALPHTVPGDRFAGWHDGEPLGEVGPRASLWRCPVEAAPAVELAAGRLMPWGDGWALAIESLTVDAAACC